MPDRLLLAATALDRLGEQISYLRGRVGEPADDEVSCAALIERPEVLGALLDRLRTGREVDDEIAHASVFSLSYGYRVAGTTLAAGWLGGAFPDPSADNMAIGISRNRPACVVYRAGHALDVETATERLFAEHLDPLVVSLRQVVRIGERLVWGNLLAGVVSVARAVCDVTDTTTTTDTAGMEATGTGPAGAGAAMWERFAGWVAAAPHDLGRFGAPISPEFRRTTCCLWWKTAEAAASTSDYCSDCSLTVAVHTDRRHRPVDRPRPARGSHRPAPRTPTRESPR